VSQPKRWRAKEEEEIDSAVLVTGSC